MSKPFVIAFSAAVVVIALLIVWFFQAERGNHLVPEGRITQVRTVALDDNSSAVIVDFEASNPSDRDMVVRFINVVLHRADGTSPESMAIAASDMPTLFQYHRELGAIEHEPLRERDKIAPHRTAHASTAVRFDLPKKDIDSRRDVQLILEDVTGPKLELTAK